MHFNYGVIVDNITATIKVTAKVHVRYTTYDLTKKLKRQNDVLENT